MRSQSTLRKYGMWGLIPAAVLLVAGSVRAQTDASGQIIGSQWLMLGPFGHGFACTSLTPDQIDALLVPQLVGELEPRNGDSVEIEAANSSLGEYAGETDADGLPFWRPLIGSANSGSLNFSLVNGGDHLVLFVATYVEFNGLDGDGVSPANVDLCVASDDGVLVWIDEQLVHDNTSACRAAEVCQDRLPLTIDPGFHRILMAVFDAEFGWEGGLGFEQDGQAITSADPDWVFHGTSGQAKPRRTLSSPGNAELCPPRFGGPVSGSIQRDLLGEQNAGDPIAVVEDVTGPFTAADVTADGAQVVDLFDGFVKSWLLLGPFTQDSGFAPGEDAMRLDYMTDGDRTEVNADPLDGDDVQPDYGAAAASTGLASGVNPINENGTLPTWTAWIDEDDTIDFADYYGGDVDDIVMFAFVYLKVEEDIQNCHLGLSSDDSVRILLDGTEVHLNSVGRGFGESGVVLDRVSIGTLTAGTHRLLVKVFDGEGGHGFRLRFQDAAGEAIVNGLRPCLDPDKVDCGGAIPFAPSGARISWNTTAESLLAGLDYTVNIDVGTVKSSGRVDADPILGPESITLLSSDLEVLEDLDLDGDGTVEFQFAHGIGKICDGTAFTVPGDESLVVAGAGADIWRDGDQFLFAYTRVSGDFSARVTIADADFAPGSRWGKHGIMARQDCGSRSRYSFIHEHGEERNDSTRFASRPTHGGIDNREVSAADVGDGIHTDTLRLDREGSVLVSYVWDPDGRYAGIPCEWVEAGRHDWGVDAPDELSLGLAVTSHQGCDVSTITFVDWELVQGGEVAPALCAPGVEDLACAFAESDDDVVAVEVTWTNSEFAAAGDMNIIEVDGQEVLRVAGDVASATLSGEVLQMSDVPSICVRSFEGDGEATCCSVFTGDELHINAGGPRLDQALGTGIGDGRIWLEDTSASPSPFLTSPNAHTADAGFDTDTQLTEPDFIDRDGRLFATERWSEDGSIEYTIPVPLCTYEVTLLFAEGCCSDGCEVLDDPLFSIGDCRVVDIFVNDDEFPDPREEHFSQVVEIMRELGIERPRDAYGKSVSVGAYLLEDVDEIAVRIQDLGPGSPPENASIKGLSIRRAGACADASPRFRRGDTDASGVVDISDPIFNLTFQFVGGVELLCEEAADVDNSGVVDISDPIYNLTFQFVGGLDPPPAPGPGICGSDADDGDNLTCEAYPTERC